MKTEDTLRRSLTGFLRPPRRVQHFLMPHTLVRIEILREQIAFQILGQSEAEHVQEKSATSLGI